jgi:hypothetical protein
MIINYTHFNHFALALSPEWHLDKATKVGCRQLFSALKAFPMAVQGCASATLGRH